jgi:hypothetical protein
MDLSVPSRVVNEVVAPGRGYFHPWHPTYIEASQTNPCDSRTMAASSSHVFWLRQLVSHLTCTTAKPTSCSPIKVSILRGCDAVWWYKVLSS